MNSHITKQRTSSIDLFRYLCAVMVVIIHSSFWHSWGQIGFFIGNIFPRIAVPFFFAVSGYFYIKGLESGKKVFWKQIKHLLTIYALWTFIYYVYDLIYYKQFSNIIGFTIDRLVASLYVGSAGHFWFFPAIIISTCLVTLFYKAKIAKVLLPVSIGLYIIGCLGCSYFGLGNKIPLLGALFRHSSFETIRRIFMMGFPFFASGALVIKLESLREKNSLPFFWLIAAIVFVAEICLVSYFKLASNVIITFGLYPLLLMTILLLFKHPMPRYAKAATVCRTAANFTYYVHPLLMQLLAEVFGQLEVAVPDIAMFFITVLTAFAIGYVCHLFVNKKNSKLVKLFVG